MVLKRHLTGSKFLGKQLGIVSSHNSEQVPVGSVHEKCTVDSDKRDMIAVEQVNSDDLERKDSKVHSFCRNEIPSLVLLTSLYFLQGLPMGLMFGSIPFLMQERASYTQIGIFTLATYPYSLKLLWSPLVDGYYSRRMGRRKTWIIPVQTLSGLSLVLCGKKIESWVENVQVTPLTVISFLLVLMVATQDIAVDGWALTMLSKTFIGYASTCQSLGVTCGFFSSFTGFLALSDEYFCDTYIRFFIGGQGALLSLSGMLILTGILYLCLTAVLIILKREDPPPRSASTCKVSTFFHQLYRLMQLPNLRTLIGVLLLAKIAFAVQDNVYSLKLLERGFRRQDLAFVAIFQLPFQVLGTILIGRWSTGVKPLSPYLLGYKLRLILMIPCTLVIVLIEKNNQSRYFIWVVILNILYHIASDVLMFVSMGAYFARISDENIGGTYLTLLNTLQNLGGTWPKLLALLFVDRLTWKHCESQSSLLDMTHEVVCKVWVDGMLLSLFFFVSIGGCFINALDSTTNQIFGNFTSRKFCFG
ncbi:MFS transporter, PAT family isoform 2 [Galdieria sulphuraria]|uniref:MFS transporter, PAT family isoform 2 n=1 Tax=Galdieria sulphuraria TaxID=130081 RepID=M2WRJ4_GALSU|nr:MFS transporter, PAT family isoform 2 [Galdieria sulphuraria]EME26430.1 MFS transporter, PAT family isoform 2 [Galdieria sulphuraria]|eukprot:XP_005702950.1 MFS transporter, PAT family isoform 2 [Galdieria sulphuraria]